MITRYFSLLALSLLIFGCQTNKEDQPKPFGHTFDIKDASSQWDSTGIWVKSLLKDGNSETIELESIDWNKEVQPFLNLDWNVPANKEKYQYDSIKLALVGETIYRYQALDSSLAVQLAEYRYQEDRCTEIHVRVREKNVAYNYYRDMILYPGEGYKIKAGQEVTGIMQVDFKVNLSKKSAPEHLMGYFHRGDMTLPVRVERTSEEIPTITFVNGTERIESKGQKDGDSIIYKMPVFPTELHVIHTKDSIIGKWYNNDREPSFSMPFTAGLKHDVNYKSSVYLNGKWHAQFHRENRTTESIAIFEQDQQNIYGTFVTQSGDYRSLQGEILNDSFYLSAFEGSHIYLFTGKLTDGKISGNWYSGLTFQLPWTAEKDSDFELPDADTLTYLKPGFETVSFTFPDLDGNQVSLSDDKYKGKPVILTIMGSWCPNCMDEGRYLKEVYNRYHDQGLEIIGLSFERRGDFDKDLPALKKAVEDLDLPYDVLFAGKAGGKYAAEALPMLNHVISFPTSIYLDRSGKVVKIHTGFTGPGTGELYTEFVAENEVFLKEFVSVN